MARPCRVHSRGDDLRADWVVVDVSDARREIGGGDDVHRGPRGDHDAKPAMSNIEPLDERRMNSAKQRLRGELAGEHQQVNVVAHERVGQTVPVRPRERRTEITQVLRSSLVEVHVELTVYEARDDVVNLSGNVEPHRHAEPSRPRGQRLRKLTKVTASGRKGSRSLLRARERVDKGDSERGSELREVLEPEPELGLGRAVEGGGAL